MSLILYPETEKEFSTNGIGILSDATDAEVYEVLNSQFELTLRYPVTGLHFESIVPDAYITAKPNPVDRPQPFRIYRVTKPMRGAVTVYARHAAYNNRKITVTPFVAVGAPQALQGLKSYAVNESPFTFWTDVNTEGALQVKVPTDAWSLMGDGEGSILSIFGGEYQFDHWDIRLHRHRGADRGVVIRYGKNLTDLTQDENIADMFTGVCPFWAQSDGKLLMLPEKTRSGPGIYAEEKIFPLDASSVFSERPTEEQLRAYADQYIAENSIGTPAVSLTVEFAQPDHTDELSGIALLEQVLLGDTVSVFFPKLKVNATARAVAARYLPLLGRYKNITIGSVTPNLARTVSNSNKTMQQNKAESKAYTEHAVATQVSSDGSIVIDHVENMITVYTKENEIPGKITLSSAGIYGYGWNEENSEFQRTLIIRPGYQSEGVKSATTINSFEAEAGLHLVAGAPGAPVKIGFSSGIVIIEGSEISIGGKQVSWMDNNDGTHTLIGR